MSQTFPEPLEQYWFLEVVDDEDLHDLLIVNDIAHVLESCGYPQALSETKALEIFYNLIHVERGKGLSETICTMGKFC